MPYLDAINYFLDNKFYSAQEKLLNAGGVATGLEMSQNSISV